MADSSFEYEYAMPLSGLHFIVHQQAPVLMIKHILSQCRTMQHFFVDSLSEEQIFVLRPNYDELVKGMVYFSCVRTNFYEKPILIPEHIALECRKSDT
jgi:hypothetical protein